jgi:DNA-directed RNA polymerase specialized sigma24 family protein
MTTPARLTGTALSQAQGAFATQLPDFDRIFHRAFRKCTRHDHDDLVAEARGSAWKAWASLTVRGRDPLDVGARTIAAYVVRHVLGGRTVASRTYGHQYRDLLHPRFCRRHGIEPISLDAPREDNKTAAELWEAVLRTNLRTSVPRQVAFRLDFRDWLAQVPPRKRQVAELLAAGHDVTAVAQALGVTPSAISQSRTWLERSWRQFEAGPTAPQVPPRSRDPRGRKRSPAPARTMATSVA